MQEVAVELVVVLHVAFLTTLLHLVERRLGDIDVAVGDQIRHVAEEERQQQRADVGTVYVGVRHDDHAVVAQLLDLEIVAADAAPQSRHHRPHFRRRQHLVEARLLHVQDLAAQRQDGLRSPVAALLGGAACRIALHQKYL